MKNPLILSLVLLLSYISFCQTPPNDACANAVTLTVAPDCSPTAGTLYNSAATTAAACGNRRDVWYRFTVPALTTSVKITVTLTSFPSSLITNNTFIDVLNGNTCASAALGGCNNVSAPRTYGGLTPGATYLFRINTNLGGTTSGG